MSLPGHYPRRISVTHQNLQRVNLSVEALAHAAREYRPVLPADVAVAIEALVESWDPVRDQANQQVAVHRRHRLGLPIHEPRQEGNER